MAGMTFIPEEFEEQLEEERRARRYEPPTVEQLLEVYALAPLEEAEQWAFWLDRVLYELDRDGEPATPEQLVSRAYAVGEVAGVRIDTSAGDDHGRRLTSADHTMIARYDEQAGGWLAEPGERDAIQRLLTPPGSPASGICKSPRRSWKEFK